MSLPNDELLSYLKNEFVVGWSNIKKEEFVGMSHGYRKNQTAVGTTNGAGGRNVQLFILAADLTVLHVLPGFWHHEDLLSELRFAKQLHRLWLDGDLTREGKDRMAAAMRRAHTRSFSDEMIARSDWQGFDRHEEMRRYQREPRDTVALDRSGRPKLKPVCQLVHDRMASRTFSSFDDFDIESFVDYGRPYYDNNSWIDKGQEFSAAKRANKKRMKQLEKDRKAAERNSK